MLLHTHIHTHAFLVHTHTLSHTEAFTHRRFYTHTLSYTEAFTHRSFEECLYMTF